MPRKIVHNLIHNLIGQHGQRVILPFDPGNLRIDLAILQRKTPKMGVGGGFPCIQQVKGVDGIQIKGIGIPKGLIDHGTGGCHNPAVGAPEMELAVDIGVRSRVVVGVHYGRKGIEILWGKRFLIAVKQWILLTNRYGNLQRSDWIILQSFCMNLI